MIFGCLVYVSRISGLNIVSIEIADNNITDADAIKAEVQQEISGDYLWFIPKANILLYPENKIKELLSNDFKRLKDINLSIKDNQTLLLNLTERMPLYTWCGNNIDTTASAEQKCYFLDKDGYIYDEAPYFSGDVYFKFYGKADIGTYFYKDVFTQLAYLKDTMTTMGLKPVSMFVDDLGDAKVFLASSATVEPYIAFKIDSDFQNVAENLETALSTEPLLSNFKNKYASLEYIDLRFGNKVYYKFSK